MILQSSSRRKKKFGKHFRIFFVSPLERMSKSLIFSVANRFGKTYSGSCALRYVKFLNQMHCCDADNTVLSCFDFLRSSYVWIGLCRASTQYSSSDGVQLFGFTTNCQFIESQQNFRRVSSSSLCPEPAAEAKSSSRLHFDERSRLRVGPSESGHPSRAIRVRPSESGHPSGWR